jgi:3,4-dihydroxy 2-butanone 4-phosphate synthase/GTP cyclohydrolase II
MQPLDSALARLRAGGMVVLTDDEARENEGDLVIAARFADTAAIAFMAKQASGLICLALAAPRVERLGLGPMPSPRRPARDTAFLASIEAARGVTTGISAADRARTIAAAIAPEAAPADLVSPGHVFPLRARPGGVLERPGHTEGAVDLVRLAALGDGAVICEIMGADGAMLRGAALDAFAKAHDLPMLSIADIAAHRLRTEDLVEKVAQADLPTAHGAFTVHAFRSRVDGSEVLALVKDGLGGAPLVRLHSECLTGDALGSLRCDCGVQLDTALARIAEEGAGALLYLRGHEGRGIGLADKIRAYALQDEGLDTVDANRALGLRDDVRDYGLAAQVLKKLGAPVVRLLSNNPAKAAALRDYAIEICEDLPLVVAANPHNLRYLAAKRDRLGHRLPVDLA